ncbi:MAG: UPF0182 family protein [Firmicutes bacterium]|nr:UPF0182 family protein [Bacillota bacterium]MDD4693421.1 UPF0182 family protein [Bacillota bacterium]
MRKLWLWLLAILVVFVVVFVIGADFFTDILWYESLGYLDSFYTILKLRIVPGLVSFLFIYAFLSINWVFAQKTWEAVRVEEGQEPIKVSKWIIVIISLFAAIAFNSNLFLSWKDVARFLGRSPFGIKDPIFNLDVSFYVFTLPLIESVYHTLLGMTAITAIAALIFYLVTGCFRFYDRHLVTHDKARIHLLVLILLAVGFGILGWQIKNYELLRSPTGVIYGAGYSDIYGRLVVNRIMQVLSFVAVVIFVIDVFRNKYKLSLLSLAVLIGVGVLGQFVPVLIQNIIVAPNELTKERPFIEQNIKFTRFAYNLNEVTSSQFEPALAFSSDDWIDNAEVLENVRLWDWRALDKSFAQLQELRYYYKMDEIDIDRYVIDDQTKQVAVSVRELDLSRLSGTANSWVNKHLIFTHGYGLVMSSIHNVTTQGIPKFLVKDIPPKGAIDITRPEIYFGEKTNEYVIVNTDQKEMNYPSGEDNVYTSYRGEGGIEIGGFFKRLLFSLKFGSTKIILSSDINNDSRVMYHRNIIDRVQRLAPFLTLDPDAYAISINGRIYWLMDAYTLTDHFPYSQPIYGLGNYMRASFKIIVDAYTGNVDIYLYDESDPLGRAYQKVFPTLIKSKADFPEEFIPHIRYPEQLFLAQSKILETYHMTNPEVFFNKEDIWEAPKEVYQGQTLEMEPYYAMVQFPDQKQTEFVLMLPFTPKSKQNMVAWLAGRSDGESYGDLVLYRFPKDRIIYGPMQIEARINQDPEISQLLSLWDQQGSSVQRGNLLVLPLNDSLLYVEPIYLQANQGQIPELRLVVLSDGNNIIYGRTFSEALEKIKGESYLEAPQKTSLETNNRGIFAENNDAEIAKRAWEAFLESEDALQSGPDWQRYGEAQAKLRDLLARLNAN